MRIYFPKIFTRTLLITGLVAWCATAEAADPTPVSWEKDIQPIVADNCSICHSGPDPSGNLVLETKADVLKVKANIIKLVSEGVMPEGNPEFGTSADGIKFLDWLKAQPDPVTYDKDIKPIIAKACSSCHNKIKASGGLSFDTEEQVVAARKKITEQVTKGSMPRGNRTWKNTPEAKILLDWIVSLDSNKP